MQKQYYLCNAMLFVLIQKSAKHIIDIRGMSVFEWPGDSLDFKSIQEDLNIMQMSCEE